eukprot:TRINITY_DN16239_c0_g2_i1.p1 TRINITY_DN16239_c0_g2~~TRINITY_DN16239_c0_g2_i1.p1  ORF type:complete len:197 (+),score=22.64 TRINITY_DN16239_c0_g2_i1:113-703(+)
MGNNKTKSVDPLCGSVTKTSDLTYVDWGQVDCWIQVASFLKVRSVLHLSATCRTLKDALDSVNYWKNLCLVTKIEATKHWKNAVIEEVRKGPHIFVSGAGFEECNGNYYKTNQMYQSRPKFFNPTTKAYIIWWGSECGWEMYEQSNSSMCRYWTGNSVTASTMPWDEKAVWVVRPDAGPHPPPRLKLVDLYLFFCD